MTLFFFLSLVSGLVFMMQTNSSGCPIVFDSVSCWPQTPPNTSAILSCFTEFLGINYDGSREYCITHFKIIMITHKSSNRATTTTEKKKTKLCCTQFIQPLSIHVHTYSRSDAMN